MAKTIKFNLICNGNPVRTLDDLRNNFSIEDVLEYYKNQLLQRWLTVRGYSEELKKLESIKESEDLPLIKALIDLFEVEVDSFVIEKDTYILSYKKESEFLAKEYEKQLYKISSIIDDYHAGYHQLIDTIIENKNDIAKIKAAIKEINKNYLNLYELNYRELFYTLQENAPMAIFVMLMESNMREKYLPIIINKDGGEYLDTDEDSDRYNFDKDIIFNDIKSMIEYEKLLGILKHNLMTFQGQTDGYWKDVEPKGKRYLILKMESGNFIRSAGLSGGDLNSDAINNKFMILDGIDYKSNNAYHKLLYMEV